MTGHIRQCLLFSSMEPTLQSEKEAAYDRHISVSSYAAFFIL